MLVIMDSYPVFINPIIIQTEVLRG